MVIEIIKSLVLGAVEGLTEFLPISSTGHLILVNEWIHFSGDFTKMFDIIVQLGAIMAVIVYFWPKLWPFDKDVIKKNEIYSIWKKTIIAVIPALVVGGLLGSFIEKKLFNPWVVAGALIVGGLIILFIEKKPMSHRFDSIKQMPWQTALAIGFIQCLSMIPGTSRSAATIIGALILGTSRTVAVEFSFFLAIPTMIAASGYSLLKHGVTMTGGEVVILFFGFVSAFLVALGAIRFLIKFISNHDFKIFGYYRLILGTLVLVYYLILNGTIYDVIFKPYFIKENDNSTDITHTLTESEARVIAGKFCIKGGEALSSGVYNENSKTWWYDANLNATRPGCSPACVVDTVTKKAEVNWRCTGLKEPVACTMDAKQCSDGSYVGRTGPNCEFVCP